MVTVVATKEFTHHGQSYRPGDGVTCEPIDALVLNRRGFVSLASRVTAKKTPATRNTYKRRDMRPEE